MGALGIRTIIVATDLSAELIPAVQTAARLAQLTDAELHVVHTTEARIAESRLADYLQVAEIAGTPRMEARILVGPPGALIVQDAFRLHADVIIFGPHRPGRSGLGSTTYRVLLAARTPCLMLPVTLPLPLQRVVAPVDLSSPTRSTLVAALTWASALRQREPRSPPTELIALHVVAGDGVSGDAEERLAGAVEEVTQPFRDAAGVKVSSRTVNGTASTCILDLANAEAVDLIVMGARGRDPRKDALGSVSREIVTHAQHAVLLVPPALE